MLPPLFFLFRYDELKRSSSRDRSDLEDHLRTSEQNRSVIESQYQKSMLEFNHTLSTKQSELSSITNTLRQAQAQLADSNPDILKQIEYVKDDLSDLFISEAMYLEYSAIERHRQTIREYVCCTVYELLRAEKNAKDAMGKEVEMIREKLIKVEDECDRNARERDQIAKLKRARETELQSELMHYETLNSKLHDELSHKNILISSLESKGEMFDALRVKCESLESDYQQLQQKDLLQTITCKSLTEEKDANATKMFNLEKSQDMLRQDKMYLTKEVDRLTEVYRDQVREKERIEMRVTELKKQKEELVEKLVRVREEHQSSYEEKLNNELQRLQTRTASDIESIRVNQRDAFEREIAGLKESRDQLAKEHEKLKTTAENTREDYHALQEEFRRLNSTLESERTDTRNALKLKSFEYDRLSLTYEESMSDFRKLKIEHEVLNKKQSVLKTELYTVQGDTQKRIIELEASEKNLQEKLSMYQQLEYELDMAILNAGSVDDIQSSSQLQSGQIKGIHHMLESLGANVPTANKRRIKQSILLAQQVVEKSRQVDVLTKEVQFFKDRSAELDTELDSAKAALGFVAQPHNYLITNLQTKDAELLTANKKVTQLTRSLEEKTGELQRLTVLKTHLENDLQRLLAGKTQLDEMKDALLKATRIGQATQGGGMLDPSATMQLHMQSMKENARPTQPQAQPSLSQPFQSMNDPKHHFAPHRLAASQGPPTSSIPAHNQPAPMTMHATLGRTNSMDAAPTIANDQPKPLWFKQLSASRG